MTAKMVAGKEEKRLAQAKEDEDGLLREFSKLWFARMVQSVMKQLTDEVYAEALDAELGEKNLPNAKHMLR